MFNCHIKMFTMKYYIFCAIFAVILSINLANGDSSEEYDLPNLKLYERKQILNVKSSRLDDLVSKQIRVYDPILESLILDSSDYLSATGLYLVPYHHKAANLKRAFGGDGPDYFQGRIITLLSSVEGVLYSAGATIEQIATLLIPEFKQSTWYRMDYNSDQFSKASSLLFQLTESVNIDYMVPYSTRRPEFLQGVSEEFYYAYMSLASYMSEQSQQSAIWEEVTHIETTALQLASELGVASTEITQYTDEIRNIFTTKFDALNLAGTKFYAAAMDAHSSVSGIVLRYYELLRQSN